MLVLARAALLVALLCAMRASAARNVLAKDDCPDVNCQICDSEGYCDRCLKGYQLLGVELDANQCQVDAPAPLANQTTTMMDIAPRIQYMTEEGFCAEEALQMAAMYHGVWLPQLYTRRQVANQSLLTGPDLQAALDNWDMVMEALHIDDVPFNGSGYQQYLAFAKQWVLQKVPVVVVAFIPGESDKWWDHAQTLVGITTASPEAGFDPQDVFHVNTVVDVNPPQVLRLASEFHDTREKCMAPLEAGGCISDVVDDGAGWAIRGMAYAGIGPRVQLTTEEDEEPTVEGEDTPADPEEWEGTAVLSGLQPGKAYTLYKFTDPALVPASADDKIDAAAAAWSQAVTATAETEKVAVEWNSGKPAYFIAVEA